MRYSRQEALIGKENQELLNKKTVAVVGIGALGTHSVDLLARMGVNLTLIDFDRVDLSNLQRQSLFDERDIGKSKVRVAKEKLGRINSEINIEILNERLSEENSRGLFSDLVLDCTDNMETRFLINKFCFENKIPWVHSAAIRYSGVVLNIIPGSFCFNCVYNNVGDVERCEDVGILNSIASLISSIQVSEAIKILLNRNYEKNLIRINLENNDFSRIKVSKNEKCEICKEEAKEIKKFNIKLCKTKGAYSVRLNNKVNIDFDSLKGFKTILETPILMVLKVDGEGIVVQKYGEVIFKKLKDEDKIIEIAKKVFKKAKVL